MKNGLPPAWLATRSASSRDRSPASIASSIECGVASGSTQSVTASGMPPAQLGRASRNSQRATHTTISGNGRASRTSCSIRSNSSGSASWRSSKTSTTGPSAASPESIERTPTADLRSVVQVVSVPVAPQAQREAQTARGPLHLVGVDPFADALAEPPEDLGLGSAALLADLAVHHLARVART